MKKKAIIGIIVAVIVIAIVAIIAVCSKKEKLEEVKIPLQIDALERTVSVIIGYPKDSGIVVEDTDWDDSKVFKNSEKNYELTMSLSEDTTYEDNKEYAKDEDYDYEEITIGNYSGYVVKSDYNIEGRVLLEEIGDGDRYIYLAFDLEAIESYVNDDYVDLKPIYELEEVQKIIKSVKYDKGESTTQATKEAIEEKEEEEKTSNYGEFSDRSRTEGTSDKEGLIFIPSFESPKPELYRAEQRNDNVGVDNNLWYIADDSSYNASGIEVRVFPKSGDYEDMEAYKEEKGSLYNWKKETVAGKEYDTYTFGSDATIPEKYSKYYNGAFMVGNKVVEFSYNVYAEVPDQDYADKFFNEIIDSIEYSKEME